MPNVAQLSKATYNTAYCTMPRSAELINVSNGHQSMHIMYTPATKSQDTAKRRLGSLGLSDKDRIEVLAFVAVMLAGILIVAA